MVCVTKEINNETTLEMSTALVSETPGLLFAVFISIFSSLEELETASFFLSVFSISPNGCTSPPVE